MTDISKYFADQLVKVAEIQEIIKTVNAEFDLLHSTIKQTLDNMYAKYTDNRGCERYEKMFDIIPRESDTLDDRRFRVLLYLRGDTPYTLIALKKKLDDLCGADNVSITLDAGNYTLDILVGSASKNQFDTVYAETKNMIPANIVYTVLPYVGTFEFSASENEYDESKGFANDAQTIGGYLGAVEGYAETTTNKLGTTTFANFVLG